MNLDVIAVSAKELRVIYRQAENDLLHVVDTHICSREWMVYCSRISRSSWLLHPNAPPLPMNRWISLKSGRWKRSSHCHWWKKGGGNSSSTLVPIPLESHVQLEHMAGI